MKYTRRKFLQSITSATIAAAGASILPITEDNKKEETDAELFSVLPSKGRVLFQGDSITDAGRDREQTGANSGLGTGYSFLITAYLRQSLAERNITFYNRGISGNKVFQLDGRWEEDCLEIKPDLLSILVGVNDFWHTLSHGYDGTVRTYQKDYEALLERTLDSLGNVQVVIGEPFVVEEGSAVTEEWFPAFREYQLASREVAEIFGAAFIPYQSIFDDAIAAVKEVGGSVKPTYWSGDGVHPSLAGSQLMARGWLETVKRL